MVISRKPTPFAKGATGAAPYGRAEPRSATKMPPHGIAFLREAEGLEPLSPEVVRSTFYTAAEVRQHCRMDDCWVSYGGLVYDLTRYVRFHPGGLPCLERYFGYDMTSICRAVHGWVNVSATLAPLAVGTLRGPPEEPAPTKLSVERGSLRPPQRASGQGGE